VPSSVADAETLRAMIALTREVPVADDVARHAVDLVIATHPESESSPSAIKNYVRAGASPRGAQALILGAKSMALLDGRPSASTDDVRSLAATALAHRLVVGYEAAADGMKPAQLIEELLDAVPAPSSGVRGAP
jgi:MoxR-like ATPase